MSDATMKHYEVRLESPADSHARIVKLTAESQDAAVALAEDREREFCATQLADDYFHLLERAGGHRDQDGRIRGLTGHQKAQYQAHTTDRPYAVAAAGVQKFDPIWSLVDRAKALQDDPEEWQRVLTALRDAGIPLAAVTGTLYGLTAQKLIDGSGVSGTAIAWTSDTIKVALTTSTYTPAQDTDAFFSDVTNEITGTGYTAGGATLASKTSTYDTASNQIRLDAADTTWTSSTLTARIAVVYKSTGTSTTSPVYGWVDFGADETTSSGTLTITWASTGICVYDVT